MNQDTQKMFDILNKLDKVDKTTRIVAENAQEDVELKMALTQKPIFLATGDATMSEIDDAIRTIEKTGNKNLVLMQCITNYPSQIESANINVIKTYKSAYNVITGYSDHSPGDIVILGSIALGAKVIEKHVTLDNSNDGPDHPHSMNLVRNL